MFVAHTTAGCRESLPGVCQRTLGYGEKTLMVEFCLQQDAALPLHQHPHEQTGYLVSGRLNLTIGNETRSMGPADGWTIPANTPHGAVALSDAVAVEVFSPVREDYLPARPQA